METTKEQIMAEILLNGHVFQQIIKFHQERRDTMVVRCDGGTLCMKKYISCAELWRIMMRTSIGRPHLSPYKLSDDDYVWLAMKLKRLVVRRIENDAPLSASAFAIAFCSDKHATAKMREHYRKNDEHYRGNRRRVSAAVLDSAITGSGLNGPHYRTDNLDAAELAEASLAIKYRMFEMIRPVKEQLLTSVYKEMSDEAAAVFDALVNSRPAHERLEESLNGCRLFYYETDEVHPVKWSIITNALLEMSIGERVATRRRADRLGQSDRVALGHHLREHFRGIVTGSELHYDPDTLAAVKNHINKAEEHFSEAENIYQEAIMSTKYAQEAVAKPTLVFGQDTTDMSENDFLSAIRKVTQQIESYADIKDSKAIDAKVSALKEKRKELVALLDATLDK